ncbi:HECT-domain-containing protein [Mycena kentingensis (nom. inval.)]|nr:HECT-domain-containing protein [Mycena kentingensis (nom. inval.)]
MFPFGVNPGRRQINLGGSSSNTTLASLTDQAKARRNERQLAKRQLDAATRIQAWWRACATRKDVRLREGNLDGVHGLRCVVFLGRNEELLGAWSRNMASKGAACLYSATDPRPGYEQSWGWLVQRVCELLLRSVAASPLSPNAIAHLKVLNMLLSPEVAARNLGGHEAAANNLVYVLRRGFYGLLGQAIRSVSLEQSKTAIVLASIVPLITLPFTALPPSSAEYSEALSAMLAHILTIPMLPSRLLHTNALPHLSANLPVASFPLLPPLPDFPVVETIDLLANLVAFLPPERYAKLDASALVACMRLLAALCNALPPNALEGAPPPAAAQLAPARSYDSDSDDESRPRVSVVSSFASGPPPPPLPTLNVKTKKRLQTLVSATYLNALLGLTKPDTSRPVFFELILALEGVWPSKRSDILTILIAGGAGANIIKELWRGSVRRAKASTILQEFTRPSSASEKSPISAVLFLADLYHHVLLTMGDDEFFGTSTAAARNPLSLDELSVFSRLLLDVAFGLYQGPQENDGMVVDSGSTTASVTGPKSVRFTWEAVREKVTKCLVAIHARDSRRPFTPPDHWLVSTQIDIRSFVEAALFEEQQLRLEELQISTTNARAVSTRQIARLAPRLGILHNIPFSIPFSTRVQIFRNFIYQDIRNRDDESYHMGHGSGRYQITVRRDQISRDGFDRLKDVDLKGRIGITFIDQFGEEEAGIDGGGVFKEFFTSLCKEVFDTDRGLWLANKKNELYPNPHAYAVEAHSLNWYRFIGRIVGKAMYEGILVDIAFAGFFLAKWLGKQSYLDDLASLDPVLYNGLIFLKHYDKDPEDLSINFTVAVEDFGVTKTVNLMPNGSNIPVTRENRLQYIYLVSHYKLSKQIRAQSDAFFEGLSEIIDHKWLRMFNQQELQILIGGTDSPVDVEDLEGNTQYGGIYDANHPTIVAFWRVVRSLDQEQRRSLLRFVTSCSRPPLLGFKELMPNFAIRDAGSDELRLPTSSTCVNLLKLPRYSSEKVLRAKLMQAITANAGFDLS